MVNPCFILGYNSLDKIAGIIFITKNRTDSFSDHRSAFALLILPRPLTFLRCRLVRIDCTAPKLMPTSLAMIRRSRLLSHITRVCTTLTFSSSVASLGRPDGPSSQTFSFSVFFYCPFIHCATCIRWSLLPKGVHEVFMNFLGRHSFFTEVLDSRSDFKFLHFANESHPPSMTTCFTHF